MSGPRNYTDKTLKRLFGLAGNRCSFPSCEATMADGLSAKNANICHIEAAKPGGERFNASMTDKERADYSNLILLCPRHHDITNDVRKYTVTSLQAMKAAHEREIQQRLAEDSPLQKRPSLLTDVINKIVSVTIDDVEDKPINNSFSIEEKIQYNDVIRYRPFLKEYKVYQGKINRLYSEFEKHSSPKKDQVLRAIKASYIKAKGAVCREDQSLNNIRKHADMLIDTVKKRLHDIIDGSTNNDLSISYEEIDFAVSIIIVDGFLRCKILEEPNVDY
jgi:hypothetical protein